MLTSTPDHKDDDGKGFRCALSCVWVSYNLVLQKRTSFSRLAHGWKQQRYEDISAFSSLSVVKRSKWE